MSRRTRYAFLMMILIASVCTTAKLTSDAVRLELGNATDEPAVEVSVETDEVKQFRLEREQLRDMQKGQLNDIIHDPHSDGTVVKSAQEQLLSMLECEATETALEGILKMRGFEDAVVVKNSDNATVLVRTESLNRQQSAVILDLIAAETKISAGNVKIIPIN